MGRFGITSRNAERQMVVDFTKRDGNGCSEYSFPEEAGTQGDL